MQRVSQLLAVKQTVHEDGSGQCLYMQPIYLASGFSS